MKGIPVFTLVGVVSSLLFLGGCLAVKSAAPPLPVKEEPPPATLSSPSPTKKLEKVKIVLPSRAGVAQAHFMGKEMGIFAEEGIDLDPIDMKATLILPSLLSGDAEYASLFFAGPFEAGVMGLPTKGIMVTMKKPFWSIIGTPGINSPADLKGKKIGVASIGATAHYATREGLKQVGIDPDKDITFVAMAQAEMFAALKAKAIAAAALVTPFTTMAKKEGMKVIFYTGDFSELPPGNGLGTTDKKIKENPGQVKRMIRGTLKALFFMRDKPKETIEYYMKAFDTDRDVAEDSIQEILKAASLDGGISDRGLQLGIQAAKDSGRIKGDISVEKGMNFIPLKEVQRELKLIP
ncbi:MAG: ABC transporter substrate-binding protein [Chloroflexi bacterium]|nr:ABC transporter substrate-binding protein [Chloroflexota bacterium]